MGISEMAVIFLSLGVALANFKVAELFYRNRFHGLRARPRGGLCDRLEHDDFKPLNEEGKRLYQRIVAKLNYLAHDRLDLKCATSCLAIAVSSPSIGDMRAAKRVGRYLRKALVAWQGFPFHDPRTEEILCYTNADWASDKTSRRSTSGDAVGVTETDLLLLLQKKDETWNSSKKQQNHVAARNTLQHKKIKAQGQHKEKRTRGNATTTKQKQVAAQEGAASSLRRCFGRSACFKWQRSINDANCVCLLSFLAC